MDTSGGSFQNWIQSFSKTFSLFPKLNTDSLRQRASRASVLEVGPAGELALMASPFGHWILGVLGKLPRQRVGSRSPTQFVLHAPLGSWEGGLQTNNLRNLNVHDKLPFYPDPNHQLCQVNLINAVWCSEVEAMLCDVSRMQLPCKKVMWRDFSDVLVWWLFASNAEGMGSIPSQGTKTPHVTWQGQKKSDVACDML